MSAANSRLSSQHPWVRFAGLLLILTGASLLLFVIDALRNHSLAFTFFITNLCLAWLPLLFAAWLVRCLRRKLWSSWEALLASVLWILFLPNSFYMVTDFIHLDDVSYQGVLYDAVMFTSFIFTGVVLGLSSLYLVHREFDKRFTAVGSTAWLCFVFVGCGFAIYLGRDLRWNSWDVFTNPGGLLFDISDRLLHPSQYPEMFLVVFTFFVLIGSLYTLAWRTVRLVQELPK